MKKIFLFFSLLSMLFVATEAAFFATVAEDNIELTFSILIFVSVIVATILVYPIAVERNR
ncbi:hypothetical protein [Flammeovirga kamogawensis]|uniref:Uncharacterized protein n=1 Tax=Flammeovirga kamogawensis TaxID=373891 RepID=A0ABX8GY80_9BACT|nr:hypothetical protein [Flammeovirga kamogawensis]MBB6458923.1 putative membrane protein [Flammeovirga kamogawensis]QWG08501.1 hypothetical protein KM029_06070 [Flammeovirga kamogawensis]TRX66793.1 hypothetical protein EO216_01120 [Flammeovirga kamogawensis]